MNYQLLYVFSIGLIAGWAVGMLWGVALGRESK